MTDIFISYRRGDGGWAGRLFDRLEDRFDTYFDTDRDANDYGADFPEQIAESLDECRVSLAVIGPEWLDAKNLERLADPADWVRRELEASLAGSPRIRTVPVLVGGALLPDPIRLPEPLRPLVTMKNAVTITHDRWESDLEHLVGRVEYWLTGQAGPLSGRSGRSPVQPYVCLCDRVEQQDALIDLIQASNATRHVHVCVVHGHKWELHANFLDRLRYRRVLEDLFDAHNTGVACVTLQWNRDKAKAGRHADVLRRALKGDAMQRPGASDAQLLDYLGRLPQPLVAVLQVTWEDYTSCSDLVAGLRDAWMALFEAATTGASTGASSMAAVLWINVTYEDDSQALPEPDLRGALPRLAPITRGHIADWLAINEVKRAAAGYETKVLALTEDERYRIEQGRVRMQSFVDEVMRIVAAT